MTKIARELLSQMARSDEVLAAKMRRLEIAPDWDDPKTPETAPEPD